MVDLLCKEEVHGEVSGWSWGDVKNQLETVLTSAAIGGQIALKEYNNELFNYIYLIVLYNFWLRNV